MTQAPERRRADPAKRPVLDERPARMRRPEATRTPAPAATEAVDKTAWSRGVVIANAALILVVAIVGIRYTQSQRDDQPDETLSVPQSSVAPVPEASASAVVPAVAPAATVAVVAAPVVKTTMRSDFAAGDGWPVGADGRESGSMAWPLGVVDGVLTHGAPTGSGAVSWLQKWTKTDVRRIGARVRFAPNHSGEAALTAWFSSVLDETGSAQPRTGMRLVATPKAWTLVALDGRGEQVLGQGSYRSTGKTASFDLVRKGSTAWVTDPSGTVTQVQDQRISRLSGPWATWELREDKAGERPAAFAEVWAG